MPCSKSHILILRELGILSHSQRNAHNANHKCAGCAYVEGIKDALDGKPKAKKLSNSVQENQKKLFRHIDAYEAYELGYYYGLGIDN